MGKKVEGTMGPGRILEEERRKQRPKTGRTSQKALQNPYKRE